MDYIEVLRRRQLHHAKKRLEYHNAARDSVDDLTKCTRQVYHVSYGSLWITKQELYS